MPPDSSELISEFPDPETRNSQKRTIRRPSKKRWLFVPIFAFFDALLWILIYFGGFYATGGHNVVTLSVILLPLGILIVAMALIGGYRYKMDFASVRYASEHLIACGVAYAASSFFLYIVTSFGPNPTSSRAIFTTSFVLFAIAALLLRRFYWFKASSFRAQGKFLVIADDKLGPIFHRDYKASGQHQQVSYVAANKELRGKLLAGEGSTMLFLEVSHILPHLNSEDMIDYEAIVVATDLDHLDPKVASRLAVIHFDELPVYTMDSFYENYWVRIPLQILGPAWPIETEFLLVQHSVYASLKRLIDFLVAVLLLILVAPIMGIVMVLIMILDGRPVIFSQQRVGIHGRPFTLYKFRSMKVGSDKGDEYTREKDSRVTALGTFLRKTRIDELPQLWNVLRGDMSMIGPRAEWTRLVEGYEKEIHHYHFRHLVRPGITGWAQVNYPYGASLEDARMKFSYDLYYIRNFSLNLDAEVLLKTLHVVAFGKGR
jgi:exopolysaccharide biosynthesis polyprenyl glycosylphosphotransferase